MLSPTLSPDKPTLMDSAMLSLRANSENVNYPDIGNTSFQENLDRQISDQKKVDQQNSDRLARQQQSTQSEKADNTSDETVTQVPDHSAARDSNYADNNHVSDSAGAADGMDARENNVEQKTVAKETHVNKKDNDPHDKKPTGDHDDDQIAVNAAGVVLQKQTVEAKKAASDLKANDDSTSALSAPDAAITALIDSREAGEKMTVAWKKGEPNASTVVLANTAKGNSVQTKHPVGDANALAGLASQALDSTGDNKKSQATGKETVNLAALGTGGSDKTASAHGEKTQGNPASDVSTLVNQLNLAMGTISASTKTSHSIRLNSTLYASDGALTSLNTAAPSSNEAKSAPLATAAVSVATNTALSPDFVNRLSEQVMWLRHQNINVAELRLHPRDLGSVLVRIDSSGDNTTVNFVAAHDSVRNVLDQNMTKLHELFNAAGLNLVDVHVSSDAPSQQQQGAMSGSGHSADYKPSFFANSTLDAEQDEIAAQGTLSAQSIHLVDFFA